MCVKVCGGWVYACVCVKVCGGWVCVCAWVCIQLTGHVPELWTECSDVLPLWIDLLSEGDGAVVGHRSLDKGRTAALHPQTTGHCRLIVQ